MSKMNPMMLLALQRKIEKHLEPIEKILGQDYKITLIALNSAKGEADIVLTQSTRSEIIDVANRYLPESEARHV